MSKTLIKQLAHNAKVRMINSKYPEKVKIKSNVIDFTPIEIHKNQIEIRKMDTSYDEILRNRIISVLEEDIDSINPISKLIDYAYFNSLSEEAKQKYILEIAQKYTEIKKEFINSKLIKFG